MEAYQELVQILEDTKEWALDNSLNFDDMYSDWSSQGELLAQLNAHIVDARRETADFDKLSMLYAPTAGLCEIVAANSSVNSYMNLAARFDDWHASVNRS
ncbi:MAG: hypothetical protein ABJF89_10805 [Parasphingorhabdus sp.]|uniref:hypothetical protein n=1 Tax=Parasphingorhabdus sp. TaxID=2709688 RepID=UPI003264CF2A